MKRSNFTVGKHLKVFQENNTCYILGNNSGNIYRWEEKHGDQKMDLNLFIEQVRDGSASRPTQGKCNFYVSFSVYLCDFKIISSFSSRWKMVGWHHWLGGHEFGQAPEVGDGQGGLACCSPRGCKESDMTERLNWTEWNITNIGDYSVNTE